MLKNQENAKKNLKIMAKGNQKNLFYLLRISKVMQVVISEVLLSYYQ